MKQSIALIAPGRVGCAVVKRLYSAGYPLLAVIGREKSRAIDACRFIGCDERCAETDLGRADRADIIILAVPDDKLAERAEATWSAISPRPNRVMIHFSGLHAAGIMKTPSCSGKTLSIHPLFPFADRGSASQRLTDCACAIEGDKESRPLGEELVAAFFGRAFQLQTEHKALYHTAASVTSNFLVSLLSLSSGLLERCGIDQEQALSFLVPLARATLENVSDIGTEQGLTGPIVRGDAGTVQQHLAALDRDPELKELYRHLAKQTLQLAKRSKRLTDCDFTPLENML